MKGINWKFSNDLTSTITTLLVGVILARLIPPKDFGLLGMSIIFLQFANVFSNLGIGPAIIQRDKIYESHINVAMTISILIGFGVAVIFWFCSYPISIFFNQPELLDIIKVLSINFILNGFFTPPRSLLIRNMNFKSIFIVETTALAVGYVLVAIILAVYNFGVWSLVFARLAENIIKCVFFLFMVKPKFKFSLRKVESSHLLNFGGKMTINHLINYLSNNADYFIIGKFLSPTALGLYTRAFNLMTIPHSKISNSLSSVLFPAFSKVQKDLKKLENAYFKSLSIVSLIGFPILTFILLSSEYVIIGIYGRNWAGSITPLRILCLAGILKMIFHMSGLITSATANIGPEITRQFVYLIIVSFGSFFGCKYGIEGVAVAVVIGTLWLYLSMTQLTFRILKYKLSRFFLSQSAGFLISLEVSVINLISISILNRIFPVHFETLKLIVLLLIFIISFIFAALMLPSKIKETLPISILSNYFDLLPIKVKETISKFGRIHR